MKKINEKNAKKLNEIYMYVKNNGNKKEFDKDEKFFTVYINDENNINIKKYNNIDNVCLLDKIFEFHKVDCDNWFVIKYINMHSQTEDTTNDYELNHNNIVMNANDFLENIDFF